MSTKRKSYWALVFVSTLLFAGVANGATYTILVGGQLNKFVPDVQVAVVGDTIKFDWRRSSPDGFYSVVETTTNDTCTLQRTNGVKYGPFCTGCEEEHSESLELQEATTLYFLNDELDDGGCATMRAIIRVQAGGSVVNNQTGGSDNVAPDGDGDESISGSYEDEDSDTISANSNESTSNDSDSNSNSNSNSGSAVPIIVGSVIGVLALCAVVGMFFYMRRRLELAAQPPKAPPPPPSYYEHPPNNQYQQYQNNLYQQQHQPQPWSPAELPATPVKMPPSINGPESPSIQSENHTSPHHISGTGRLPTS